METILKRKEMEMVKDDEIMSAEEFFGGIDDGKKNGSSAPMVLNRTTFSS